MERYALALGLLAGLVQLLGYWQYNRILSREGNKPNAASWFMWGVGGFAELVVFAALVERHADGVFSAWSKEILPALCAVAVLVTFVRIWWRERSLEIARGEWAMIALDSSLVVVWFVTQNPYLANLLLGADIVVTFVPYLKSAWADPKSEHPLPWAIWTLAYALLTLVVIIEWESAWELIYPVLYLVLDLAIWLIVVTKKVRPAAVL